MLKTFIEVLMGAEADAICGAPGPDRGVVLTAARVMPVDADTLMGGCLLAGHAEVVSSLPCRPSGCAAA